MLRTRWILVVSALGMSAFTPIVDAADTISGYGLYKSTSSNWTWDPVPDTGTIAGGGEADRLVFTLPRAVFPSWPDHARVGIVSGMLGTPARCWVSRSTPFQVDPNVQSPWASNLIAGSALYSAKLFGGGEGEDIKLELLFDATPSLHSAWDLYLLIDMDGSEQTGFLAGDYLIQNVSLGSGDKPGPLTFHWLAMRPEMATVGQVAEVSVVVQNTGREPMTGMVAMLDATAGLSVVGCRELPPIDLRPLESKRVSWRIAATKAGAYRLKVQAAASPNHVEAGLWISFVACATLGTSSRRGVAIGCRFRHGQRCRRKTRPHSRASTRSRRPNCNTTCLASPPICHVAQTRRILTPRRTPSMATP